MGKEDQVRNFMSEYNKINSKTRRIGQTPENYLVEFEANYGKLQEYGFGDLPPAILANILLVNANLTKSAYKKIKSELNFYTEAKSNPQNLLLQVKSALKHFGQPNDALIKSLPGLLLKLLISAPRA